MGGVYTNYKGYYSSLELLYAITAKMKSVLGNNELINRDDFLISIDIGIDFNLLKVISAHINAVKILTDRADKKDLDRV